MRGQNAQTRGFCSDSSFRPFQLCVPLLLLLKGEVITSSFFDTTLALGVVVENERGIKRLVATVNWKISVYSSNIFILTKEPHQEADTSKLGNIQIIKSDELKMLF